MLFDTGPEDRVFEQNVSRLGLDLGPVEAMVLSHGHWDHAGAMLRALQLVRDRNGGKRVAYYVHPDMFRSRAVKMPDGSFRPMEDVPSLADLDGPGRPRRLHARAAAHRRHRVRERRDPAPHAVRDRPARPASPHADGKGWEPDELLIDERFVAVNVRGKGLVVLPPAPMPAWSTCSTTRARASPT